MQAVSKFSSSPFVASPSSSPLRRTPFRMDGDFYRELMEGSEMTFLDYDGATDTLTVSFSLPGSQRVQHAHLRFRAQLATCPSIPASLRQSTREALEPFFHMAMRGKISICMDLLGEGAFRWYHGALQSVESEGRIVRIMGYLRDIQAEKTSETRLENLNVYRQAVDQASLYVYEFDLPRYAPRITGKSHENDPAYYPLDCYLSDWETLIHPEDQSLFRDLTSPESLLNGFRAGRQEMQQRIRMKSKLNQWVWMQLTVHLCPGAEDREAYGIGYIQLIHTQKMMEERATLDAVTGLLNRATLEERIAQTLQESQKANYFFIFDIDNFKTVNDTDGHAEGDRVLRLIAEVLRHHTRKNDLVGRIGGDEFVALLSGLPSAQAALHRAEEILAAVRHLKSPAAKQGGKTYSLSIGMAVAAPGQSDYQKLYQAADKALYEAKGLGKDRCCAARA